MNGQTMLKIDHGTPDTAARPWWPAVKRGLACRCPNCGEGRLFQSFLKVAPTCEACGTVLHHHRADDMPPYITMFIVGHIVIWLVLIGEIEFALPIWVHVVVWPLLTLALSFALMQPVKGAVVGLQWANRMHGFGHPGQDEEAVLRPRREPLE